MAKELYGIFTDTQSAARDSSQLAADTEIHRKCRGGQKRSCSWKKVRGMFYVNAWKSSEASKVLISANVWSSYVSDGPRLVDFNLISVMRWCVFFFCALSDSAAGALRSSVEVWSKVLYCATKREEFVRVLRGSRREMERLLPRLRCSQSCRWAVCRLKSNVPKHGEEVTLLSLKVHSDLLLHQSSGTQYQAVTSYHC